MQQPNHHQRSGQVHLKTGALSSPPLRPPVHLLRCVHHLPECRQRAIGSSTSTVASLSSPTGGSPFSRPTSGYAQGASGCTWGQLGSVVTSGFSPVFVPLFPHPVLATIRDATTTTPVNAPPLALPLFPTTRGRPLPPPPPSPPRSRRTPQPPPSSPTNGASSAAIPARRVPRTANRRQADFNRRRGEFAAPLVVRPVGADHHLIRPGSSPVRWGFKGDGANTFPRLYVLVTPRPQIS